MNGHEEANNEEIHGIFEDLASAKPDITHMVHLFKNELNYDIYPKSLVIDVENKNEPKQYWTEKELKHFLTDRGKYLELNIDNNKKYDALFVLVSCHGLGGYICTSDKKLFS
eukprot:71954_1